MPSTTVDESMVVHPVLDEHGDSSEGIHYDALRMTAHEQPSGMTNRCPGLTHPHRRAYESRFSEITDRLVKVRHDGSEGAGHPAFNTSGPAPSIARVQEYEELFGGPC